MLVGLFFPRPQGEFPGSLEAINAELVMNAVNMRHGRNDIEEGGAIRISMSALPEQAPEIREYRLHG